MIIFLIILVVILVISGFFFIKYNDLKEIDDRCNKALTQIKELLDSKEKDINLLLKTVKNKKINKLQKIDDDMSIFDVEEILFNFRWEINKISIEEYLNDEELNKIIHRINLTDESLDGLKDFYNTNANKYDETFNKFSWFFKLFKFKKKECFKVRKIDEYEILKN